MTENINSNCKEEMKGSVLKNEIPIWEKYTLTIREASRFFHIGEKKLRRLVEERHDADFIVMNGNRVMIKRKAFERKLFLYKWI